MTKKKEYLTTALKDINSKLSFLVQTLLLIKKQTDRLPTIARRIQGIRTDLHAIRMVTADTNNSSESKEVSP